MKATEFVSEVRMGSSDLQNFLNSPVAEGIRIGFEAELCFEGLGSGDGEYDYENEEPDYGYDTRTRNIDTIVQFFRGDYNERSDTERLKEALLEDYYEWRNVQLDKAWNEGKDEYIRNYILNNEIDYDDELEDYLKVVLGLSPYEVKQAMAAGADTEELANKDQKRLFPEDDAAFKAFSQAKEAVEEIIREKVEDEGIIYDARQEFVEEHEYEYEESDWLSENDLDMMTDIERSYDINWPYWEAPESSESGNEYDYDAARQLASSLETDLEVFATAARGGYHSVKRDDESWILEPDSSIEANMGDMPVEIISPPMPIKEGIQKMQEFFTWAKNNDAYSNKSTGLHIGVSLPSPTNANIDYVKLALFLGDKYVLNQFGRASNTFCKSSLDKIEDTIKTKSVDFVENVLSKLNGGLQYLAQKALGPYLTTNNKYVSINMKTNYIEFRSMGGHSYLNRINDVINMVLRFAYAMSIAGDSTAEQQEYRKKLYKLLQVGVPNKSDSDIINIFTHYKAGTISKEQLTNILRSRKTQRQYATTTATEPQRYWWHVRYRNASVTLVATDEKEAKEKARRSWNFPSLQDSEMTAELSSKYNP